MLEECLYQELLTDVVDIILHCVDHNHLKQRPLHEVFPPVQTFHQVMYCRYLIGYEAGVWSGSRGVDPDPGNGPHRRKKEILSWFWRATANVLSGSLEDNKFKF
jgi:hypothetical protein